MRGVLALRGVLVAKGQAADLVEDLGSLRLALEARSGSEAGPFLRTPEGFVLSGLPAMLEWIERVHPEPALVPRSPARRIALRLVEDWLEYWLPLWPRRSWSSLEAIGAHLERAGFLLGVAPTRADWLLAAWLESEVLVVDRARRHLAQHAPRLVSLGADLLAELERTTEGGGASVLGSVSVSVSAEEDDALPISLLDLLEEIAGDYHAYLDANRTALKEHVESVELDVGLGKRAFETRAACEASRFAIGQEIRSLAPEARKAVRRVLEPVGVWHVLTLPAVLDDLDPADPRTLC